MYSQSPCLPFPGVIPHTHTQPSIPSLYTLFFFFPLLLSLPPSPPLFVHLSFNFGLCWEVVKKPYEICMKDCEPRDWPHLPDSRANERPHWIIPHNASGTKAQQLTLEREMKRGVGGGGDRVGRGRGCKQLRLTAGQEAACSHTQLTRTHKTKACGTGITPSVRSLRSLSLDSSQPLLLLPSLPPSHSHSLARSVKRIWNTNTLFSLTLLSPCSQRFAVLL